MAAPLSPEDAVWAAQTAQAMCAAAGQTFVELRQWDPSAVALLDQRLHELANVITSPAHVASMLHLPVLLFIGVQKVTGLECCDV